jgi:nucleotide-binding universal stress UspA family protein
VDGIIIGVDESAAAAAALVWGHEHARAHGRPATALMAWSLRDQHPLDPDATFDPDYGGADSRRDLAAIVQRALGADAVAVSQRTVRGGPVSQLVEASATADLVVVGARGSGGFHSLLLGSVSRRVLHGARCPVAVIRAATASPDGPIVVGVDGSAAGRAALKWAIAEARVRAAPLVALHAWQMNHAADGYAPPYPDPETMEKCARALLEREVAIQDTTGLRVTPELQVVRQRPAAALVESSAGASLVVVGGRGRRAVGGLPLGSVSDQVAHHAEAPTVVVPDSGSRPHPGR